MNTNTQNKHISLEFGEVLTRSYKRAHKTFLPLLAFFGITWVILISSALFLVAVGFGLYDVFEGSTAIISFIITAGVLAIIGLFYILAAFSIVNIKILNNPTFDYLPLIKESLKEVVRVFSILLVTGLAILGGVVLGILPGIWLGIVLYFCTIIAVLDKKGLSHTVAKSAHLVKNNFWNVFSFAFFFFIGSIIISLIPWFGDILNGIFSIFSIIVTYELYMTLEHNKKISDEHTYSNKNILLVTKLFSVCAVFALLALSIIASTIIANI